jgi:uncharacterized protein with GYD domain
MPTYISLLNWSQKGIEEIKESPARLDQAKKAIKKAGGKMTHFMMTMGQYDMVVITEAPNEEVLAKVMLAIAAAGGVRSETLRAFNENEYRKIIGSL